jgi:hypothetical protein
VLQRKKGVWGGRAVAKNKKERKKARASKRGVDQAIVFAVRAQAAAHTEKKKHGLTKRAIKKKAGAAAKVLCG